MGESFGVPGGAAAGSSLLALVTYQPAADTFVTVTNTASFADVDVTNLAVTFTAPPSGRVLVRATVTVSESGANNTFVNLREGAADIANTSRLVVQGAIDILAAPNWVIGGLTPASSHTYKLGAKVSGGAGSNFFYGQPSYGPFVFEVWSA